MTVRRLLAERTQGSVVMASATDIGGVRGMPTVRIEDLRSVGAAGDPGGRYGITMGAAGGGTLTGERVVLSGDTMSAVAVYGRRAEPETAMTLRHVIVEGTRAAACGSVPEGDPASCLRDGRSEAGGIGVLARDGGRLSLETFAVRGAELAGVLVAPGGRVELHRGLVAGNALGINLMVDDYDLALLDDEVFAFGNATDVAREELVLPDPGSLLIGAAGPPGAH